MAQTILYYPDINIQDGAWLRNAILYWDEVSSIAPFQGYADLSPEQQYLQNAGVYNAVYPNDVFFSNYSDDFCNCIIQRITAYKRFIDNKTHNFEVGKKRIHDFKGSNKQNIYAPALCTLIHYNKLPQKVLSFFIDNQIIKECNENDWLEMDSKIAQIYMRTLAEYSIKCSDKDIVLGTDTVFRNQEIYNWARNRSNSQTQCCKINILNCLPQPSLDVSFEDILDFKERRKDELNAFRAKIRELETNIYQAESPEQIKHFESQFIESWENCSDDYRRVLAEARIHFLLSSLVSIVAVPRIQEALPKYVGQNLSAVIKTGLPLLNIGISYLDYQNKISPAKTDGGFSYIIKAKTDGIIHF